MYRFPGEVKIRSTSRSDVVTSKRLVFGSLPGYQEPADPAGHEGVLAATPPPVPRPWRPRRTPERRWSGLCRRSFASRGPFRASGVSLRPRLAADVDELGECVQDREHEALEPLVGVESGADPVASALGREADRQLGLLRTRSSGEGSDAVGPRGVALVVKSRAGRLPVVVGCVVRSAAAVGMAITGVDRPMPSEESSGTQACRHRKYNAVAAGPRRTA